MEFAKEQLEKQGWTQGKGLGKDESGISEAVKVAYKNDTMGVGFDQSQEFTFHWWDHIFNKAAKSIEVKESENGIEISKTKKDDSILISSKKPNKYSKETNLIYGRFVKAASTTEEKKESDDDVDSDDELDESIKKSDSYVFNICGGRTAHKGARHGLKCSGKLQRLEEQERSSLPNTPTGSRCSSPMPPAAIDRMEQKEREKMGRKKNTVSISETALGDTASQEGGDSEDFSQSSKRKKKRKRNKEKSTHETKHQSEEYIVENPEENDTLKVITNEESSCFRDDEVKKQQTKKLKRKKQQNEKDSNHNTSIPDNEQLVESRVSIGNNNGTFAGDDEDLPNDDEGNSSEAKTKKKRGKKKKTKDCASVVEIHDEPTIINGDNVEKTSSKKKRKRRKEYIDDNQDQDKESSDIALPQVAKKKKKRKLKAKEAL